MTATPVTRATSPPPTSPWEESLAVHAREQAKDSQRLRWAVATAVLVHVVLLLVQLPTLATSKWSEPEDSRKVFVLAEPRFEKPEPRPETPLPERRLVRVPVPDPTPDDPEPLPREEIEPLEVVIDDIGRLPEIAPPAPPPSRPRRVAGEIKRPERLSGRQPLYTELARRVRLEGTVIVDAVIDENGRVTEVELLRGLGFGLDEEVVDAVGTWQFRPATLGGKPIAVLFTLTVHFDLK